MCPYEWDLTSIKDTQIHFMVILVDVVMHFCLIVSCPPLQAVCENAELSDAEKVYAECGQQRPLPWEECILPHRMRRCVKIGEGTFGEVFSTTNASGDTVALKVRVCVCVCYGINV